jgi:hypothetical protein
MRPLPLNMQTLYADLLQSATFSPVAPASVYRQTIRGNAYLYAAEKHGSIRRQRYLGPAADADVRATADDLRYAAEAAKGRRKVVSMLKRLGVPGPAVAVGRTLESLANAGLFRNGLVLVGTGAYQIYSPLLGLALSLAPMLTQDVDVAAVSLAVTSDIEGDSLLDVLQRADASFAAPPALRSKVLPWRFRAASGLQVEVVTRVRKRSDEEQPVQIAGLKCSAQPLRYLEYLTEGPVPAVALYGSGVPVVVPQPARYAVHKLIVAQVRRDAATAKRGKDLHQAAELLEALQLVDPEAVGSALEDARARGRKWQQHIAASLRAIGYQEGR